MQNQQFIARFFILLYFLSFTACTAVFDISKYSPSSDSTSNPPSFNGLSKVMYTSPSSVRIYWESATSSESVTYEVCYSEIESECKSSFVVKKSVSGDKVFSDVNGLDVGKEYYFAVRAKDSYGNVSTTEPTQEFKKIFNEEIIDMAATGGKMCMLTQAGEVWCWGEAFNSDLGLGDLGATKKIIAYPTKVNLPVAAIDIDMNSYSNAAAIICAVLSDNTLWCWGYDIQGQSGSVIKTPQQLTGFSPVSKVEAGFRHLCALTTDQRIQCIGEVGRLLGRGTSSASYTPDYVSGITTATDISVGYADTCALLQDQTVRCWGDNNYGQLGVGDTTGRSSPVDPGLSNITQISSGSISSCAVNTSNELYCWGLNSGTLLDTDTSSRTPVQMTQLSNVQSVSVGGRLFNMAGTSVTCAVDNLDKLSCWGEATYGSAGEDRTLYNELQINSDFTDLGIKQVFAFGEMHPIVCVIPKAPYKGLYCRGRILAATEANNWEHIKEVRRVDNLPQKTN